MRHSDWIERDLNMILTICTCLLVALVFKAERSGLSFHKCDYSLMHRAQSVDFWRTLKKFPIKTPGSIEKQNESYSKSLKTHFAQKFWCLMKILFLPHTGHWGPKYVSRKVNQNEFCHTMSKTTTIESDMAQHNAGEYSFFTFEIYYFSKLRYWTEF